jgi:uncharacterized protein
MPSDATSITVVHNLKAARFEAQLPEGLAHADYRRVGDTLHMTHTEVPDAARGRGIAAAIVQAALDFADENRLRIVPMCAYVRGYMQRHPETHALLAPSARL